MRDYSITKVYVIIYKIWVDLSYPIFEYQIFVILH